MLEDLKEEFGGEFSDGRVNKFEFGQFVLDVWELRGIGGKSAL